MTEGERLIRFYLPRELCDDLDELARAHRRKSAHDEAAVIVEQALLRRRGGEDPGTGAASLAAV